MTDEASAIADEEPPARQPVLEVEGLEQCLRDKERPEEFVVYVRQKLTICEGDFVALLGPSGCGKTTLLTVLGLLRAPSNARDISSFRMWVEERGQRREVDLREAWMRNRNGRIESLRRRHIGFALQSGELLPALTVGENIAAPLKLNGAGRQECQHRVRQLVEAFSLVRQRNEDPQESQNGDDVYDLSNARVNKLSGGESQRVSLARSIAHRPRLVFVDEPTAALNRELAHGALEQLQRLQQDRHGRSATVMITHDTVLAEEFANVTIRMAPLRDRPGGEVVEVVHRPESRVPASSGPLIP